MGYIPNFEHDIFISYAHVDNLDGWVEAFHQHLEVRLARVGIMTSCATAIPL